MSTNADNHLLFAPCWSHFLPSLLFACVFGLELGLKTVLDLLHIERSDLFCIESFILISVILSRTGK